MIRSVLGDVDLLQSADTSPDNEIAEKPHTKKPDTKKPDTEKLDPFHIGWFIFCTAVLIFLFVNSNDPSIGSTAFVLLGYLVVWIGGSIAYVIDKW